jgi:hypothetical protein
MSKMIQREPFFKIFDKGIIKKEIDEQIILEFFLFFQILVVQV